MSLVDPTWPEGARRLIEAQQEIIESQQKLIFELQATVQRQAERIEELEARVSELEGKLEKALRAGKRQAAPFRKTRKKNPKRPGRKKGKDHGGASFRAPSDKVDKTVDAPLPPRCEDPDCDGSLEKDRVEHQFQVDIPPIKPETTQINVHIGHCTDCGRRHQGRHPCQTSDALGSAGLQIGPNLLAHAAYLNKIAGVPYAKMANYFWIAFMFRVAPSTLVRAMLRLGDQLDGAYEEIRSQLQNSAIVYPDETGWRVGGFKAWLWVFVGPVVTLYRIASSRGFDVASWALGEDFKGKLGHDGWSVYDRFLKAVHQTCLNHLITRCRRMIDASTKRAVSFPRAVKKVLQNALRLRDRRDAGELTSHGLSVAVGRLKAELRRTMQMRLTYEPNVRLRKHLKRHFDQIFTFLLHPDLEATNHLAERGIRFGVLIRKLGGCNKSWRGARAHERILTVMRTGLQNGVTSIDYIVAAFRHPAGRSSFIPFFLKDP